MGAGKTVIVRGIVEGLGITEEVSSPSFTITNVYEGKKNSVHHIDFYRINDAGVLLHELKEIINDKSNIAIIEWPGIVKEKIGDDNIEVNILSLDENSRSLEFVYPENLNYIFEGIK